MMLNVLLAYMFVSVLFPDFDIDTRTYGAYACPLAGLLHTYYNMFCFIFTSVSVIIIKPIFLKERRENMLNSSTGQAVGILLPFWSYLPTNRISFSGLLYPVSKVMKEGDLLRFVMLVGQKEDEIPLSGKDFFWQDVDRMYKVDFCCVDLTAMFKGRICNFTGLFADSGGFFVNGKRAGNVEEMRDIFFHWNLGEVWSLLTGDIKPSCGVYRNRRLILPETETCLGVVSEKPFPKGYDMKDLARVERLLEDAGVFKIPEEISLGDIEKKLSRFSEIDKILEELSEDEQTFLR